MSEKTCDLVENVSMGVALIAEAVVAYIAPGGPVLTASIVAAIGIAKEAVVRICRLFVVSE